MRQKAKLLVATDVANRHGESHMNTTAPAPVTSPLGQRASFQKECRLLLQGVVTADTVEGRLARYYKRTSGRWPLLFDFTNAEYVEVAALGNVIAYVMDRREKSLLTFLAYPRSKAIRDFFTVWRFPDALSQATGMPFTEFLLAEDQFYLEEEQSTYDGIGGGLEALEYDPDWNNNALAKRNFFEFTTFRPQPGQAILPEGPFAAAPRTESRRWAGRLIREVLNKHLGGESPKDDIARVAIYEAMSNAIRHPHAKVIQVVSKFERKMKASAKRDIVGTRKVQGNLRICIWDDGDTIADTLHNVLKKDKSVRAVLLPAFMYETYAVDIRPFDKSKKQRHIITAGDDITAANATEPRLLLASLFPGITRSVADSVAAVEPYEDESPQALLAGAPGMGLYALARIVVDQFVGTLVIRSGSYRLKMRLPDDRTLKETKARYWCKITQYPQTFPRFRGNLLALQVPVGGGD